VVKKVVKIDGLSASAIAAAERGLLEYAVWVEKKSAELRSRLATLGATVASIRFSRAIYSGTNDVSVRVDDTGDTAVIYAEGETVAFIEFGAGATHGYGHPMAGKFGVGPGTYPDGKGHWDDPNGWWYAHGQHTYGNPPAAAMVAARDAMAEELTQIAKEVFQ
jgi:hypothetical protein